MAETQRDMTFLQRVVYMLARDEHIDEPDTSQSTSVSSTGPSTTRLEQLDRVP